MRKFILFLLAVMMGCTCSCAQKQSAAEAFNDKVKQVDSIFRKPVAVLAWQKFSKSPTGMTYYRWQFEKLNMEMSVHGDTANIVLKFHVLTNAKSGDIEGYKEKIGYTDSLQAIQSADFQSCDSKGFWMDSWCRGDVRVIYVYQNKKWVLQRVQTEIPNRIGLGVIRGDLERGVLDPWLR